MREYLYKNSVTKETKVIKAASEEAALKKYDKLCFESSALLEWIGAKEPKIYGYCRISDPKQNIERQVRNIRNEYPDATIIQEVCTGTTKNRPKWLQLQEAVCAGDKIVFDSVSRMSRNAAEGFELYEELYRRGIVLEFLKEPVINTETYRNAMKGSLKMTGTDLDYILEGINKYMLSLAKEQIRLAFIQSQKEVDDLHQRTAEGMETARLSGKKIGRPKGSTSETKKSVRMKKEILRLSRDFNGTLKDYEILKLTGLAQGTYYKYKKELSAKISEDKK